jgi:hypothetical protein
MPEGVVVSEQDEEESEVGAEEETEDLPYRPIHKEYKSKCEP